MKKITLLVAFNLLIGSLAFASETTMDTDTDRRHNVAIHYMDAEPIVFMEREIEFYVFLNGDFDFNTRPQDSQGGYYYKRGATVRGNSTVGNFGVRIEHDGFGRVRRIGNVFINYDSQNRVNRIGSVYMRYNRFALTQIGGMELVYNRKGHLVDMFGEVKMRARAYGYVTTTYYGSSNYYTNTDYAYNNDAYYYYKEDGTKALIEDKKDKKIRM
ncbi:hypothetical protein [Flavobacterium sp.]|jgi:hypothetical protein|uniref:hypothetical protein n=1 Tax=Flavobacterium sp. TaxID=239 RepID=UPI0037BE2F59